MDGLCEGKESQVDSSSRWMTGCSLVVILASGLQTKLSDANSSKKYSISWAVRLFLGQSSSVARLEEKKKTGVLCKSRQEKLFKKTFCRSKIVA